MQAGGGNVARLKKREVALREEVGRAVMCTPLYGTHRGMLVCAHACM